MASTLLEWKASNPLASALVLSHLSALTEQTAERFQRRIPTLSTSIMQGQRKATPMADVVISTMQTARLADHIHTLKDRLIKPVGLLIVDETHMLPTASYDQIQDHFPGIPLIGYTATPFRNRKIMTNVFDKVSFSISLQELIDQGYLVRPELKQIPTEGLSTAQDVMAAVMQLYCTAEAGKQAIVYMRTVDDAKTLRNAFEGFGIRARAVTGDVTAGAREDIFRSFRSGETKVLCTVDVLTAGFDAPEVEAIFLPYKIKSPTQYLQRVGRGLRSAAGKTSCRVYAFGDAPTFSKGLYQQFEKMALRAGKKEGGQDTIKEDVELTWWDPESEIYHWTMRVNEAIEKMEKLGMTTFAQALNEKRFPERFMRSIRDILAALPDRKTSLPHSKQPATEAQQHVLFAAGFQGEICSALTKGEAHMMISTIYNRANDPRGDAGSFLVTEGQHKGKHVSELPHAYRSIMKKRYPDSPLVALITAWESRKRRA